MHDEFSKIDDALQALSEGRIIIVVDDEDRENEGDFIAAADKVTPETIEFMITHGRGQVCMPILPEVAARLHLGPMVERNTAPHQTPYTVPVDHIVVPHGHQRRGAGSDGAGDHRPGDHAGRPGSSRPSVSAGGQGRGRAPPRRPYRGDGRPGAAGRAGAGGRPVRGARRDRRRQPRSAACDRARARPADRLDRVARSSIAASARSWSTASPKPICRRATAAAGSSATACSTSRATSRSPSSWATSASVDAPLVRLHSSCFTGDLLDSLRCDCGDQLHMALEMIGDEGAGALIYLPQEGTRHRPDREDPRLQSSG